MFLGRSEHFHVYYNSFHEIFRVAQFVNKIPVPITVEVLILFFQKVQLLVSQVRKGSAAHITLISFHYSPIHA